MLNKRPMPVVRVAGAKPAPTAAKSTLPAKAEIAAPAVKKTGKQVVAEKPFTMADAYRSQIQGIEKEYNMTAAEVDMPDKLSTGNLSYDLLTSGGIMGGGMYQWSGPEGGGKSTGSLKTLGQAIRSNIPVLAFHDIENAVRDIRFVSMLLGADANEVFFGENKRAYLYNKSILENFFKFTRAMMRACPDKIYRAENDQWYYVFDNNQDGKRLMEAFHIKGYDEKLYLMTGRYWSPTDQRGIQGLVVCDSFASLIVEKLDEGDGGGGVGVDARAFSQYFKYIKGIAISKAFALIGTNQIREKIGGNAGFGMGPSYYEPGGNALMHYMDNRIRQLPRSVPEKLGYEKGIGDTGYKTGDIGEEKSFYGPNPDRYKYVLLKNTKNKFGTPYLEAWVRFCISDGSGYPRGLDPTMDTIEYLRKTARLESVRAKGMSGAFKIKHPAYQDEVFDSHRFKGLILALTDRKVSSSIKSELFGGQKLVDIRGQCFQEIKTGKVYERLVKLGKAKKETTTEDLEA